MLTIEANKAFSHQVIKARDSNFVSSVIDHGEAAGRGLSEYEDRLPKFKGRKLSEIIADKITHQPIHSLNVLDIGCGKGFTLEEIEEEYGINVFGLSSFDHHTQEGTDIDYRVGDAQGLCAIYKDVEFDVVFSNYALRHMADPLSVLKQAYSLCKKDGIVLIDEFVHLTKEQADLLNRYWESYGINADITRRYFEDVPLIPGQSELAIQRGDSPHLPLPFRYKRKTIDYGLITYLFDEKTIRTRLE